MDVRSKLYGSILALIGGVVIVAAIAGFAGPIAGYVATDWIGIVCGVAIILTSAIGIYRARSHARAAAASASQAAHTGEEHERLGIV